MADRKRILAVDDDPITLRALRQVLLHKGYEVLEASDGESALDLLEREPVDLIILDVAMPGISGFDVCRKIRLSERTAEVPVIFLTVHGSVADMKEGREAGSDLYLVKPVLTNKLLALVASFLTSEAPLSRRKSAPTED
jgi:DNA-binding response OmpR family regulator